MALFKVLKRINFFDCDPAGILFFGNVFHICHSCYEEMLFQNIPLVDYFNHDKIAIPIKKTSANYIGIIKSGTIVSISISVENIGKSSFMLKYLIGSEWGAILAEITTLHVCIDKTKFEKILIPEELMKFLTGQ